MTQEITEPQEPNEQKPKRKRLPDKPNPFWNFDYKEKFGKRFSEMNEEEKRKYFRYAWTQHTRAKKKAWTMYFRMYNKEDMFIYLFLNTVVTCKQAFIRHVIFRYIQEHAPEFFEYFPKFKFKDDYTPVYFGKMITYEGITNTISAWAKLLGYNSETLRRRIKKYHYPIEKAFLEPIKPTNRFKVGKTVITKPELDELIRKIKNKEIDFRNKKPKYARNKKRLDTAYAYHPHTNENYTQADIEEMNAEMVRNLTEGDNVIYH